jgi:tetratricopeptide (TPR) repeat protein
VHAVSRLWATLAVAVCTLCGGLPVLAQEGAAYYFTIAQMHASDGEYREAVEAFRKAIDLEPEDPYIRLAYAELLSRTGRARQAAEVAEEARDLAPTNTDVLRLVGEVRLELAPRDPRSLRLAREAFERLRELTPEDTASLLTLSRIYLGQNEPDLALEVLEEASSFSPNHPAVHRGLLEALVRSGNNERARELLPRVLRRNPSFLEGRLALARILSEAGEHDEAIRTLEQAPPEDLGRIDTKYLLASELFRRSANGLPRRTDELAGLERALGLVDANSSRVSTKSRRRSFG